MYFEADYERQQDQQQKKETWNSKIDDQICTSTRVVLNQELVQSHPATSHSDHDCAAEDAHQPELLRISKLNTQKAGGRERLWELQGTKGHQNHSTQPKAKNWTT